MSVRIYELAKELNVPNKELLAFIQERVKQYDNLVVKTPSSGIMPIYADMIKADYLKFKEQVAEAAPKQEAKKEEPKPQEQTTAANTAPQEEEPKKQEEAKEQPIEAKAAEEVRPAANKPAVAVPPKPVSKPAVVIPPAKPATIVPPKPVAPQAAANKPAVVVPPAPSKPATLVPPMAKPAVPNKPAVAVPPLSRPATLVPPSRPATLVPPSNKPASLVPPIKARPQTMVPPSPSANRPAVLSPNAQAPQQAEAPKNKNIQIKPPIIVRDFAKLIDLKPFRLISELMDMGIFASMNQTLEENIALKIAEKHGYVLDIKHRGESTQPKVKVEKPKYDDPKDLVPRPPIVCILGHVDHGKTTLLDTIRNTNVVAGEAGGITQHTAAYQVECNGKKITFIDTPGHAAFSKMRERGANVTDIAILVVAADDGFMPQTEEALAFAQKAGVPVIVAINKMDAKGANVDNVKRQMQARGISPEDWGGETLCCPVSALKGTNINDLLELVLLQAEMMELKANPKRPVEGTIIESQVEQGRGATATVIVRQGTLKAGDTIYCLGNYCRVRALIDDKGKKMDKALPGTPALVMGWTGAPEDGETFYKAENEKKARRITEEYLDEKKKLESQNLAPKAASLEDLMAAIANKNKKVFKCVVKSDVSGTVEALCACLKDIKSTKVDMEIIGSSVGLITKNDVEMAATSQANIVAFNVKPENGVVAEAKHAGVTIITHNIIYELLNQVKDAMKNLLDPELRENKLGMAQVRQVFTVSKFGNIAGCMVTEGVMKRDKLARVFRKDKELCNGRIGTLKRFKDDASEVKAGYECGINVNGFDDYKEGDSIECYEIVEIRPDL